MRLFPRFLLLLLLACAAATRGRAATPQDLIAQMLPADAMLRSADELGLAAAQRQRLTAGLSVLQREMAPLQAEMARATDELVRLLAAPAADEAAVLAAFATLSDVESRLKVLRLKSTLLTKSVLTPEQQRHAHALRAATPAPAAAVPAGSLRDKVQRVRAGLQRWQREGRDVTPVREPWQRFQAHAQRREHAAASRALDEALRALEADAPPRPPAPLAAPSPTDATAAATATDAPQP